MGGHSRYPGRWPTKHTGVALAFLVALPLVSEYGVSAEREARIEKGADRGYRTLRRLKASPYYGIPQRADFF